MLFGAASSDAQRSFVPDNTGLTFHTTLSL